MSRFSPLLRTIAIAAAAMLASQAHALSKDINLAGAVAVDDFGVLGNSEYFVNVGAGSTITGFDYLGLRFITDAGLASYQSDLVLSVNNEDGSDYLDWAPSTAIGPGTFGPASGSWNGATGQPGPYDEGASFVSASGLLYVTTYLAYYDEPVGITVNAGTLRIYYTAAAPVPEPASYALMGAGLLALGAVARRKSAH